MRKRSTTDLKLGGYQMKYIKMFFAWIWLLFANDNKKEVKSSSKLFLPMNLQYFSDGGDGGGDGGDGGSGDDGGNGGSGDEPFATFKTQDDFNKRLSRAEKKGQKELAKTLGFDSVEEMQAALDKTKKKEPNNTDPVNVDAVVESKLKEERDKTFKRLVNSEVKLNANELGFADWEDALALSDLSQVKEDEKGNIIGVKEALEELGKKKPHLLKQSGNGSFGANVPNSQQQQKEALDNMKKLAASRGNSQTTTHNPWA
jgi:hypothetical protein